MNIRFIKNIGRYVVFVRECYKRNLPLFETYRAVRKLKKEYSVSTAFVVITKWVVNEEKDTFYLNGDYLKRCLKLQKNVYELFMDKSVLYERCPDLLGRGCLNIRNASNEDILSFFEKYKKIVGKQNYGSGAQNFSVYEVGKISNIELIKVLKNKGQDLLEEYIHQHNDVSAIYPGAINTLRIHTVNNGVEIKSYIKPKMRIGCNGSDTDIGGKFGSYKLVLSDGGTVDIAAYHDKYNYVYLVDEHRDTKVKFYSVKVPYVKESIDLVKRAAARFPEAAYIGWDVAITPNGPVLVEANAISGAFNTYQMITCLQNGLGMKKEIDEMLSFAEGKNIVGEMD